MPAAKIAMQFYRVGQMFVPADPWTAERMEKLPGADQIFNVEIKEGLRSRGRMAFYWAGLGLLAKNLPEQWETVWPTSRHIHESIMKELGYTHRIYRFDGTFTRQVDSIALDNMSDEDFEIAFERVRGAIRGLFDFDPWDEWKAGKDAAKKASQAFVAWQKQENPDDE